MPKAPNPYLTVGKAARTCGVSNRTVINWISRGQLQANRLPSGHYRIHSDVLRAFIAQRRQPRSHPAGGLAPLTTDYCWNRPDNPSEHLCIECLVYRSHATHCFVLRAELDASLLRCGRPCDECQHYRTVYQSIGEGLEFDSTPCAVSRGGTILGVNSSFRALLECDGAPLIGHSWIDFTAPDERPSLSRWAGQVRSSAPDAVLRIDTRLRTFQGDLVAVTLETTWFPRIAGSVVTRFHTR